MVVEDVGCPVADVADSRAADKAGSMIALHDFTIRPLIHNAASVAVGSDVVVGLSFAGARLVVLVEATW